MEIKEYVQIIKKQTGLFLAVIAAAVLASFAYFFLQPASYTASIMLDIARDGSQETEDYKFDDFYRIQADEKFGETVVQWLKDPGVSSEIISGSGFDVKNFSLRELSKSFKAERISPQTVAVSFSSPDPEQAARISASLVDVLEKKVGTLKGGDEKKGWFMIVAQKPVIIKDAYSPSLVLLFSLMAGFFLAFWTVLIIHYLK